MSVASDLLARSTLKSMSKLLSLVLRHKPEAIGLTLDREGWADVQQLVQCAQAHGVALTPTLVVEIASNSDKQRFAISADGGRIRANQGHSLAVDLGLVPKEPPEVLYHGTATRYLSLSGFLCDEPYTAHWARKDVWQGKTGGRFRLSCWTRCWQVETPRRFSTQAA